MTFGNYDLLLSVVRERHDDLAKHGANYRIVRSPSRSRRSSGRPRSLPRGRPDRPQLL